MDKSSTNQFTHNSIVNIGTLIFGDVKVGTKVGESLAPRPPFLTLVAMLQKGFYFHHAKAEYVMLTKWLPNTPDRIPQAPSAYLGAGGFVMNDKDEVLVICERYNSDKSEIRWKIPGGLIDPGEDISEAAVREVFEETGIKTEYLSMLAFRHLRAFIFGTYAIQSSLRQGLLFCCCTLTPSPDTMYTLFVY